MAGHVVRIGEIRDAYRILARKPEWQSPLGRPKHRWEDDIKMHFQDVEWGGTNCIDLVQNRNRWRALVNGVMNLRVTENAGNFLTSWDPFTLSGRLCSKEVFTRVGTLIVTTIYLQLIQN